MRQPAPAFGLVQVGVLPVVRRPDMRSEMVTQAALGTPLRVENDPASAWLRVRMPDGYRGYVRSLGVAPATAARARRFGRAAALAAVSTPLLDRPRGEALAWAPGGSRVVCRRTVRGWTEVELPAGQRAWLKGRPAPHSARSTGEDLLTAALGFRGVPYLWGGRTGWGLDCSGLVQLAAELCGLALPRDAREQFRAGRPVGHSRAEVLRPGDLLFFGATNKEITHVGIYCRGGSYVHSCGWVRVSSLRPGDPDFIPSFAQEFRGARRVV